MDEKILIVGAGPTGLVLALWLTKLGVRVRIIDKDSGPGQTSRAMVVHARTLEFYHQIGIAHELVEKGIKVEDVTIRQQGNIAASVVFGLIGKDSSPFPFILSFPQDDHEKILLEHLHQSGVTVERNTELIEFLEDDHGVSATLKKPDGTEIATTHYLLGCDGARSVVRNQLKLDFPGGTYLQIYFVADVLASGEAIKDNMQLCLGDTDFTLVFPIRRSGSVRLIGIVPKAIEGNKTIEFLDVVPAVIKNTKLSISKLNWFSTYHSHHRVAKHFREGRVFLLGDAGHIHSPVGGQGMNTGIGDAINLAWKIAAVLQKRAAVSILDSFEAERITFAHQLASTTDKVFQAITNEGLLGKFIKKIWFPYVFPFVARFARVKLFVFDTVSQIKIQYRKSPLSKGEAGRVAGGDRLPWVRMGDSDNFKSLEILDWQIHVYGKLQDDFCQSITKLGFVLQVFPWSKEAKKAGLKESAVYFIRPDGYIAYANLNQDNALLEFIAIHQILPRT